MSIATGEFPCMSVYARVGQFIGGRFPLCLWLHYCDFRVIYLLYCDGAVMKTSKIYARRITNIA